MSPVPSVLLNVSPNEAYGHIVRAVSIVLRVWSRPRTCPSSCVPMFSMSNEFPWPLHDNCEYVFHKSPVSNVTGALTIAFVAVL